MRRTTKEHGTRGQVEGNLAGHKRVAILDDVITSGESALIAADAAESYKAQVVRVLAVVDRGQGARAELPAARPPLHAAVHDRRSSPG